MNTPHMFSLVIIMLLTPLQTYTMLNDVIARYRNVEPTSITHHPTTQEVAFYNSEKIMFANCQPQTCYKLYIHDLPTKRCLRTITLNNAPYNISYSCDGTSLRFNVNTDAATLTSHSIQRKSGKHSQHNFPYCEYIAWHPQYPYVVRAERQVAPQNDCPWLDSLSSQMVKDTNEYWSLQYWNIETHKKITNHSVSYSRIPQEGRQLLFFTDTCVTFAMNSTRHNFNVPFDIIENKVHALGTKDRLNFLRSILKKYQYKRNSCRQNIVELLIHKIMSRTKL